MGRRHRKHRRKRHHKREKKRMAFRYDGARTYSPDAHGRIVFGEIDKMGRSYGSSSPSCFWKSEYAIPYAIKEAQREGYDAVIVVPPTMPQKRILEVVGAIMHFMEEQALLDEPLPLFGD
jgi:hypothetical protein